MSGPPIDGLVTIMREVEQLRRDVQALKLAQSRTLPLGTSYRLEVRGSEGTASVWAVRSSDGSEKQLAP